MILSDGCGNGRLWNVFRGSPGGGLYKQWHVGGSGLHILEELTTVQAGVEELGLDSESTRVAPAKIAVVATLREHVVNALQVFGVVAYLPAPLPHFYIPRVG